MTKHVLFDMDGVIVHSEPIILKAAMAALAEFGVNASEDDFTQFVGAGEDMYVGGVARLHGKEYLLEMKSRTYDLYDELVVGNLPVFHNCVELIAKLKTDGIRVALASSADMRKVVANLNEAKIPLDTFDCILCGTDVVHKKPHPEIYLKAAYKLGTDPTSCLVVEDAINGVQAAHRADMRCIAVTTSFTREAFAPENPLAVVDDIADAYDIIASYEIERKSHAK